MKAQSLRTATTNEVKLEYELGGTGEPVALIHLSLYADSFAPLMDQPALAGYRLLRYHRRGYAGSSRTVGPVTISDQAADLAGLLDDLGIRRAHVVGHSYGGLIAQRPGDTRDLFALRSPDRSASSASAIFVSVEPVEFL